MKNQRFTALLLILTVLIGYMLPPKSTVAGENISVYINGQQIDFDTPPIVQNGRTLVPMRKIFEKLGFTVEWNENAKSITGKKDTTEIIMDIGSTNAYTNDILFKLDTPPVVINSRAYVPLRFIAEGAGADVKWDTSSKSVLINTNKNNKTVSVSDSVVMITTNHIQGSGVVVSSDGLIATNYHVIEGATRISIIFNNTKMYTGEVLVTGYDISRDLALIRINPNNLNLVPAKIGNSNSTNSGDAVKTIGSPSGAMNTVTTGVILNRDSNIISTTAKISQGSSGGALFNSSNELIGITSSYTSNNNYLSIPINYLSYISKYGNIPLSVFSTVKPVPETPKNLVVKHTKNTVYLNWEPMYGIDYFYLYRSETIDGEYEIVKNPNNNLNQWYWGYPHCFGLSASNSVKTYFKLASVKDGAISPLSEAVLINIK